MTGMGRISVVQHHINTRYGIPIKQAPYQAPYQEMLQEIKYKKMSKKG